MRPRFCAWLAVLLLAVGTAGCGRFIARSLVRAPNSYPQWLAPRARVELSFDHNLLTNFPVQFVNVGPPAARLCYRVVEPADFQFAITSTNWLERSGKYYRFSFRAIVPGAPNGWTASPRGTVVLLHGHALAQFAMLPWALRLAEDGWRCVLVDLRGHGKSTGPRVYFGVHEAHDLGQLLDELTRAGQAASPVSVLGESYGATLALRWKAADARVDRVVAIAPYAQLSNAVVNLSREYASLVPQVFIRAGLKQLPAVLNVEPGALDTTTVLARSPVSAMFVAGEQDTISPPADASELFHRAGPESELFVVREATHEAVAYYFEELLPPVLIWLDEKGGRQKSEAGGSNSE